MANLLALFPDPSVVHPGYSIHKKPTWASLVQTPPSGREVTGRQFLVPLWEFNLIFEILRDQSQNSTVFAPTKGYTELQTLSGFFLARNGQYGAFIYQDPDDYSRTGQQIGVGDGDTVGFPMVRTFGTGSYAFTEFVGTVDVRTGKTLNIYLNGVLLLQPGNWWIEGDLRTLQFVEAPANGVVITADFSFFYFCRFIQDALEMEEFMTGRWTVKELKFRSTIPDPPASLNPYTIVDQNTNLTTPQNALYYFEVTFGPFEHPEVAEIGAVVGFATDNFDISQDFTFFNHVPGEWSELTGSVLNLSTAFGSTFWFGTSAAPAPSGMPSGRDYSNLTFGWAVNTSTGRYWVRDTAVPGTWFSGGDPSLGTGGANLGGGIDPARHLKILVGVWWQNFSGPSVPSLVLNGAGSFAATIPAGASPWGTTNIAPGSNPGGAIIVGNSLTATTTPTAYFFYASVDHAQTW